MIITVSGAPGAGDTSLAKDLSKKLNYKLITTGETFKELAKKEGLQVGKSGSAIKLWEKQLKNKKEMKKFHKKFDKAQRELALKNKNCIVNARLGAFTIPEADLKIYLTASQKIRVKRVVKRDKISYKKALEEATKREKIERREVKKMYGFDYAKDLHVYDLIINTDTHKIKDTTDMALIFVKAVKRRK